jgi:hypothetical protein
VSFPGNIFRTIRNFLFSNANREVLIFLSFFVLAGVFWLMMRLNETYEQEVKVAVKYVNVPKSAVLTSGETDTIRATISDKGFNIISYLFGQVNSHLRADFAKYARNDGTGQVPASDLRKMLMAELPASAKVISVKPEKILFYFNNGESKRVPVRWHGKVTPQRLYFVASTKITPDSVTVYASRQKLDSIAAVYTEEINYTDFHDTLNISPRLTTTVGMKVVPDKVDIQFITDVLTEAKTSGIPIEGINMPAGKTLRTFPSKISVSYVTGMKNYQGITSDDFRVVADYRELSQNPSSKCSITLAATPEGISNVVMEMTQVDYLIEEATP